MEKKMKVRNATPHLYLEIQKGGNIPIFRGVRKRGGFSFRFLKLLASIFGKSLLKVRMSSKKQLLHYWTQL